MQTEGSDNGLESGAVEQTATDDVLADVHAAVEQLTGEPSVESAIENIEAEKWQPKDSEPAQVEKPIVKAKGKAGKESAPKVQAKEDLPPAQLDLEAKEEFNSLPPKIKASVHKMVTGLRQDATRQWQQIDLAKAQVDARVKEIEPFERLVSQSLPQWGARNRTPIQAISELISFQNKLVSEDEATSLKAFKHLLTQGVQRFGAEKLLGQGAEVSTSQVPDISNHPVVRQLIQQNQALQEKLAPVINGYEAQQAQSWNEGVNSVYEELVSVQNEKDASGRYRYPKLHDNDFLDGVKDLVVGIRARSPQLSWADAIRRAYGALAGDALPQNTIRPSQGLSDVSRFSATPRGRGAGLSSMNKRPASNEVPDSVEDSVRMSVEQLMRGGY